MCLLCVEIQKFNMTTREVASAYREFEIPEGHEDELHATLEKHYDKDEIIGELNQIELEAHYKGRK